MTNQIFYSAVTSVGHNRVRLMGYSRDDAEIYEVGLKPDEVVTVYLKTNGISKVEHCSCKHHGVKDIYCQGLCSASLAVIYFKLENIRRKLMRSLKVVTEVKHENP